MNNTVIVRGRITSAQWCGTDSDSANRLSASQLRAIARLAPGAPIMAVHSDDVLALGEVVSARYDGVDGVDAELRLHPSGLACAVERPELSVSFDYERATGAVLRVGHVALMAIGHARGGRTCRIDAGDLARAQRTDVAELRPACVVPPGACAAAVCPAGSAGEGSDPVFDDPKTVMDGIQAKFDWLADHVDDYAGASAAMRAVHAAARPRLAAKCASSIATKKKDSCGCKGTCASCTTRKTMKRSKKRDRQPRLDALQRAEKRNAKRSANAWRTDLKPNAPFGGPSGPGSGDPDKADLNHLSRGGNNAPNAAHSIDTPSAIAAGIGAADDPSPFCKCSDGPKAVDADHDEDCPLYYPGGSSVGGGGGDDADPQLDDDKRAARELAARSMRTWGDPRDRADDGDIVPPRNADEAKAARYAAEVSRRAWLRPWRSK